MTLLRGSLVLLGLGGCAADAPPCPCGGVFEDPLGQAQGDLAQPSNHDLDAHCSCRCAGNGPEQLFGLYASDCSTFETACDYRGYAGTYECTRAGRDGATRSK